VPQYARARRERASRSARKRRAGSYVAVEPERRGSARAVRTVLETVARSAKQAVPRDNVFRESSRVRTSAENQLISLRARPGVGRAKLFGSEVSTPGQRSQAPAPATESRLSSTRRGPRQPGRPRRLAGNSSPAALSLRDGETRHGRVGGFDVPGAMSTCRAGRAAEPLFARTRPAEGPASLCWPSPVVPAGPPFLTAFTSEVT
jgi:hypothetical protein